MMTPVIDAMTLITFIEKCQRSKPNQRYELATELLHMLKQLNMDLLRDMQKRLGQC